MKPTLTVPLEIKALSGRQFEGHGSMFGNVDLGGDIVMPGAFAGSLAQHKQAGTMPQMFWMHQPDQIPGMWLDMHEDEMGLAVKGEFAPTELGDEIYTLTKMQAVRGLSIGYQTQDYSYDKQGNRMLKAVDLWEVSPVSLAMNPMAKIEACKSRLSKSGEYVPTARELEQTFRDFGCSKTVARKMVSKIFGEEISGETLDKSRCDADADDVESAASAVMDRIIAGMIRLPMG